MRLINATTLKLETFAEDATPPYAILSHTWGTDEVSFQEIQHLESAARKEGFAKIRFTCEEALERGLEYAWVDTCCIDKSSSAELSEAINSMFNWYKEARECYAFLSDVPDGTDLRSEESAFYRSRWFTRGWTLQELLAPKALYFFSSTFRYIGFGGLLAKELSFATGIREDYLTGMTALSSASISRRMSWASKRITTRKEDMAYCLMGLFGINMPLLYGEGEKSFLRLQEEIIKTSNDQTIFAWGDSENSSLLLPRESPRCMFARSPSCYRYASKFIPDELSESVDHYFMTNQGLKISFPVMENHHQHGLIAILACRDEDSLSGIIALPISRGISFCARSSYFVRTQRIDQQNYSTTIEKLTFLNNLNMIAPSTESRATHAFIVRKLPRDYQISLVNRSGGWDMKNNIIQRQPGNTGPISITLTNRRRSFAAVVEIHFQAPDNSYKKQKLLEYPHALVEVFDAKTVDLVSFSVDDPAAISATLSQQPTRLSWGLEVAILDIQFVSLTQDSINQRALLASLSPK